MSKKKYILIICIITFAVLVKYLLYYGQLVRTESDILLIQSLLANYMQNEEHFPDSYQSLVDKGYIVELPVKNGIMHELHLNPTREGISAVQLEGFDNYHILYGVAPCDLTKTNNEIIDRSSGEQVFFIDGPYHDKFVEFYGLVTWQLYDIMTRVD